VGNSYRYTAREYDQQTRLYYYRARYYDTAIGRFISEDPIRFNGGIDFFDYAGNNPHKYIDPLGKSVLCPSRLEVERGATHRHRNNLFRSVRRG
jgi:RHS repeat-associated protein